MEIRAAKKFDIPKIAKLAGEMAQLHHELDKYYKKASQYGGLEDEVASWLGDKDLQILVAEGGGKSAGYVRVGIEEGPNYSTAKKIGVVYDIFIETRYRRKGIAAKLLESAFGWFLKKKVRHLELSVHVKNYDAIKFWKKLGFFEYKIRMRREICYN